MLALPIAHRAEPSRPALPPLVTSTALIAAALTIIYMVPKILNPSLSGYTTVVLTGALGIAFLAITVLALVVISENKLLPPPQR